MTRKKVNLTYISKESSRRATFRKRKKGFVKKMSELTTLCDVDACAIIFSPYDDDDHDQTPEVHPSSLGATRVLRRFRNMPPADRTKKMVDQEGFLRQRLAKASDQLKKLRSQNREKEMTRVMFQALASPGSTAVGPTVLVGLTSAELRDLGCVIDRNLGDVGRQIERVERRRRTAVAVKEEEVSRGDCADVAEERVVVMDDAAGMQQSFMELMMSHQHHHENHVLNLALGSDDGASQWGHDRVFP